MNSRQIEKIRKKFILVAMISLFIAMFFIGGAVLVLNLETNRHVIRSALDTIVDHDGDPWSSDYDKDDAKAETETETAAESVVSASSTSSTSSSSASINDPDAEETDYVHIIINAFTTQIGRYNHYFAVIYDENGAVSEVKTNIKDGTDTEVAVSYSNSVYGKKKTYGRRGDYFYEMHVREDGSTIIVFLDCRSELHSMVRLAMITLFICVIGMLITYFLVKKLSWRAIQPEIENIGRQKQFITNASHELKTPLAVIRANTELEEMLHGSDEWTQSTLNQIDRMNGLIQNLVMITKAAEQEDSSEMTEVDVSTAVNESVAPFESLAAGENKTLTRKIDPDVKMLADSSRIRQLATILIDNAFKYCDENGSIEVILTTFRKGKWVRLTVTNSFAEGAKVDCNRFFDRFYREDESHNIDKGGYGIGLSMAESICKMYGGTIHAEWKDGIIRFICDFN